MMRPFRLAAVLATMIAAGVAAPAWADDFDHAFNAYSAGDFAAALKAFTPLAEAGDPRAQYFLGHIYSEGKGLAKNEAEGAGWYRRAAERGDAVSQLSLGSMYVNGRGVRRNFVEAYKWLDIVVAAGEDRALKSRAAEVRDLIEQLMTPDQVAEAKKQVKAWLPQ